MVFDARNIVNEIGKNFQSDRSRIIEETLRESNRAQVSIGILALKAVMVVNAGALIAILASADELKGVPGAEFFLYGLIFAGFAVLLSYIYQSLVTKSLFMLVSEASEAIAQHQRFDKWGKRIIWAIIFLVSISFALFIWGGFSALSHVSELFGVKTITNIVNGTK